MEWRSSGMSALCMEGPMSEDGEGGDGREKSQEDSCGKRSTRLQEKERGARGAGGAVCCWSYARVWLFGNGCR